MKNHFLFPPDFRLYGLILFVAGILLGIPNIFFDWEISWLSLNTEPRDIFSGRQNLTNELALTFVLIGLLILCFSSLKLEDERTLYLRLRAYQWSFLVNFLIILVGNWLLYGEYFLYLMIFNLFTPLVVFLMRFYYLIYMDESGQKEIDAE
jgi:hypothetical protein